MERRRISYTPSVDIVWEAAVGEGRGDLDESGTFAPPRPGGTLAPRWKLPSPISNPLVTDPNLNLTISPNPNPKLVAKLTLPATVALTLTLFLINLRRSTSALAPATDMDREKAAIDGTDRQTDARTDGRTLDRYIDPAPHTMRAAPSPQCWRLYEVSYSTAAGCYWDCKAEFLFVCSWLIAAFNCLSLYIFCRSICLSVLSANKCVHCWTQPPTLTVKKVKVIHTRLPSVGFGSWSRFLAVSLQVMWVINPAVGCHYFPPGLQLPARPLKRVATNFAAWRTEAQWV